MTTTPLSLAKLAATDCLEALKRNPEAELDMGWLRDALEATHKPNFPMSKVDDIFTRATDHLISKGHGTPSEADVFRHVVARKK